MSIAKRLDHIPAELHYQVRNSHSSNINIPSGWIPLVLELHQILVAIEPEYEIVQIKEKFGTMRYYTSGVEYDRDSTFYQTISEYELRGGKICTQCGNPSTHNKHKMGYVVSHCDSCD